ncbi:hypothetical protein EV129_113143 [Rhizobium azibense]|uniref:Uncharacterized protein n=1 Tax=Rhizobium azibense TaxID=1136135 RepID=A0A4R3RF29_9HYPH|nr:hypothetical protein EV129_113143 [Rhizobium azibense]
MAPEKTPNTPKPVQPVKDIPRLTRDMVAGRRNGSYTTR